MAILNFRLLIEYDGSAFSGWQSQRNGRTVQDALEAALQQITGDERVAVTGAGRTDAGVHARGQVASVKLDTGLTPERLQAAVNSKLAEDVRVQAVIPAADDFHARFSAVLRRYSYTLTTAQPVLGRHYVWLVRHTFDPQLLTRCAEAVIGRHDFKGFAKSRPGQDSTVCEVNLSRWEDQPPRLVYHIDANRFLHHMVRLLVGSMVKVAQGRFTVEQFANQLENRPNGLKIHRAPAHGLVLEEVLYE